VSTWGQRGVPRAKLQRVLQRDGYECQIRDTGCTQLATEVDDILPVSVTGITRADATDDMLQAACHACHARKTERERLKGLAASNAHRAARKRLPARAHPGD
jgi:5-methylcytosine-specific restriction endonuclease McrA